MKYLEILRARLADLAAERDAALAEMEAVTAAAEAEERATLTSDEDEAFTAARSKVADADDEIAAVEARIGELEAVAERTRAAAKAPAFIPHHDDEPVVARDLPDLSRSEARDRALRILEAESTRSVAGLRTDQVDKIERLVRTKTADLDGDYIAKRMIATENDAYRSAFVKSITPGPAAFTPEEARALDAFAALEARAMSSSGSAGGYGVPVLIDPTINMSSQGHVPVILQICRTETVTTDTWKGVSSDGVSWSYDSEAAEVSDDAPTLAQPTVSVWEQRGFVPFSIRIGQDYPDLAGELNMLLTEGYLDSAAYYTALGSGTTQPYGILTALDANSAVEVTPNTDGGLYGQDIAKVWAALPERFRANATWVMSTDVGEEVAAFSNGNNIAYFTGNLQGDQTPLIRNRPVKYSDYFPSFTGSTGACNLIVVGDFRNYLWVQRAGMTVELVPHLFGTSNPGRPTGQRGLFAWARNGGDSIVDNAFRLLQNQ